MSAAAGVRFTERLVAALAITLLASAVMGAAAARADAGSWLTTGSTLTGRYPRSAITLADGRVLALFPAAAETEASEVYSPATGTWAAGPALPAPASVASATPVALAGGGALLAGGADCEAFQCVPSTDSYRLSPGDSAWLPTAPMLQPRALPTVIELPDGRALVAGGFGDACERPERVELSCAPLASAEVYDPDTNSWTAIEPLPSRVGRAAATVLSDGAVMLVGDAENGREAAWRYDTSSGVWTTIAPPSSAGSLLLALPGDHVLALGSSPEPGFFGFDGVVHPRAFKLCESRPEIYAAATDTWTSAPPLPIEPSCSAPAAQVGGGQVLYPDGGSFFLLDAGRQCWSQTPAPAPSGLEEVVSLRDGRALALGGSLAGAPPLTAAAIFTPASSVCSAAQLLKASVFSQLVPVGHGAWMFPILEHGYVFAFDAIRPGRLSIDWYPAQRGRDLPSRQAAPVAVGSAHATRPGIVKLTISLTAAGVELFENSATVQLVAKASYATAPNRSTLALRSFSLRRYPR